MGEDMTYILVALVMFFVGYVVCFRFFQKDIESGKPIAFKSGIYVAEKRSLK